MCVQTDRQTDRPQWPVTPPPSATIQACKLQAGPDTQSWQRPGNRRGYFKVVSMFLSLPPPVQQTVRQKNKQASGPGCSHGEADRPFSHPQRLPNQSPPYRAPPPLLISSPGDNPAVYSESCPPPLRFFLLHFPAMLWQGPK